MQMQQLRGLSDAEKGAGREPPANTCFAWSAMMEMPTLEMPIMQPTFRAVSLLQGEQLPQRQGSTDLAPQPRIIV
jgi:hypothetical protein